MTPDQAWYAKYAPNWPKAGNQQDDDRDAALATLLNGQATRQAAGTGDQYIADTVGGVDMSGNEAIQSAADKRSMQLGQAQGTQLDAMAAAYAKALELKLADMMPKGGGGGGGGRRGGGGGGSTPSAYASAAQPLGIDAMFGAAFGAIPKPQYAPAPKLPIAKVPVVPAASVRAPNAFKSAADMGAKSKPGYGWSKGAAPVKAKVKVGAS